jgi:hypothetical protein
VRHLISACLAAILLASGGAATANVERAWANYHKLITGTRQLAELTPVEVRELIELDRQLRGEGTDKRTPRQKCIDEEIDNLDVEPSRLALRTIDLKCSQR